MPILRPYVDLLRTRHLAPLLLAMFGFGVGWTMAPLGIVLFARDTTGSFGKASLVVAGFLVGNAVVAPVRGRWVDRRGARGPLPTMAVVASSALVALVVAGHAGAPAGVLTTIAFLGGAAAPPVSAALRSLFGQLVGEENTLHAAYAMFSVVSESTLFTSPLIAGLLLAVASPSAVVVVAAGLSMASVLGFALSPGAAAWRRTPRPEGLSRLGPLAGAGMRTLVLSALAFGVTFGQLENIALPAFAKAHHHTPAVGLLLAAIALGIASGSLAFGLRRLQRSRGELFPYLYALPLPAFAAAPFVHAIAPMAAVMLLLGLLLAPAAVTIFALVDDVAPAGTVTEAITWISSLSAAGTALGALVAGAVVSHLSVRAALAGPAIVTAAATVGIWLLRGTLRQP